MIHTDKMVRKIIRDVEQNLIDGIEYSVNTHGSTLRQQLADNAKAFIAIYRDELLRRFDD